MIVVDGDGGVVMIIVKIAKEEEDDGVRVLMRELM
jgi:hypothetical protein